MAVKFKVVKRKVLNGAEKDSVKNYAIAKNIGDFGPQQIM